MNAIEELKAESDSIAGELATNHSPADRFQLLPTPQVLPGQCTVCGYGANDRMYLDVGIDIDYHGRIYFCTTCLGTMAKILGFLSPEHAEQLALRLDKIDHFVTVFAVHMNKMETSIMSSFNDLHESLATINEQSYGRNSGDSISRSDESSESDEFGDEFNDDSDDNGAESSTKGVNSLNDDSGTTDDGGSESLFD